LNYFGSLEKIKSATLENLRAAPGMNAKVAQQIYETLHSSGQKSKISDL
jgi:excinuclease UvrABC nuclease subunit